ncbi:hypothetical protein GCM10008934_30160 [Virgibacillus salarius]
MASLRVAVIGCGSIARHRHLVEYQANDQIEIVAVCDIIHERVQEIAIDFQANAYTNYQELLEKEKPCIYCSFGGWLSCVM